MSRRPSATSHQARNAQRTLFARRGNQPRRPGRAFPMALDLTANVKRGLARSCQRKSTARSTNVGCPPISRRFMPCEKATKKSQYDTRLCTTTKSTRNLQGGRQAGLPAVTMTPNLTSSKQSGGNQHVTTVPFPTAIGTRIRRRELEDLTAEGHGHDDRTVTGRQRTSCPLCRRWFRTSSRRLQPARPLSNVANQ